MLYDWAFALKGGISLAMTIGMNLRVILIMSLAQVFTIAQQLASI
jgi:hypothetical protein